MVVFVLFYFVFHSLALRRYVCSLCSVRYPLYTLAHIYPGHKQTADGSYCHEKHNHISSYFLLFSPCECVCVTSYELRLCISFYIHRISYSRFSQNTYLAQCEKYGPNSSANQPTIQPHAHIYIARVSVHEFLLE